MQIHVFAVFPLRNQYWDLTKHELWMKMANLGLFPGVGLTRLDFDNNTVLNTTDPDTVLGDPYSM